MIISEEILKESSTYQYLIEKGVAQARRQDLVKLLTRRFGSLSTATQRKLDAAPIEKLDRWFDRALDADSLKDALK